MKGFAHGDALGRPPRHLCLAAVPSAFAEVRLHPCADEEPPYREVLAAGAIPALIAALQPPRCLLLVLLKGSRLGW